MAFYSLQSILTYLASFTAIPEALWIDIQYVYWMVVGFQQKEAVCLYIQGVSLLFHSLEESCHHRGR